MFDVFVTGMSERDLFLKQSLVVIKTISVYVMVNNLLILLKWVQYV